MVKYGTPVRFKRNGSPAAWQVPCGFCGKPVIRSNYAYNTYLDVFCNRSCRTKHFNRVGITTADAMIAYMRSPKGRKAKGDECRGEKNWNWHGGRYISTGGKGHYYRRVVMVKCPDAKFKRMALKDGYVLEHRLKVAQALGRCLYWHEVVHHIDHNPLNNDITNLALFNSQDEHKRYELLGVGVPKWTYVGELECPKRRRRV